MEKEKNDDPLTVLARSYPDPARGLRALLLARYQEITAARSRDWEWPEIAAALGKPGMGKAVASSFARLQRRVAAGEIVPPPTGKPTISTSTARPCPATKATGAGAVDPVSGFRTPTTSTKKETDDDHKWIE